MLRFRRHIFHFARFINANIGFLFLNRLLSVPVKVGARQIKRKHIVIYRICISLHELCLNNTETQSQYGSTRGENQLKALKLEASRMLLASIF
jgi:hypothetical protein